MTTLYDLSIQTDWETRVESLDHCNLMVTNRLARGLRIIPFKLENEGIRFCSSCSTFKLFERFYRNNCKKWGIGTYCKKCTEDRSGKEGIYHNKYKCVFCDYNTSKKCNYKKHILTKKHNKNVNNYLPFCKDINNIIVGMLSQS